MKTVFQYTPKLSMMEYVYSIGIPVAFIIGPIVYPFNIRLGSLQILPYPYSMIVIIIGGCIGLFLSLRRIAKISKLAKLGSNTIEMDVDGVHFSQIVKGKVQRKSFALTDIKGRVYEQREKIMTLELMTGEEYDFNGQYFENLQAFDDFRSML